MRALYNRQQQAMHKNRMPNIDNASNIPCFQTSSPKDHVFKGRVNEILKKLGKYGNYHQYNFKEMLHCHFSNYLTHPFILNRMLKEKRNPYPPLIIYRTVRNRHLESFWIKLHGISKGSKSVYIRASVENEKLIKLTMHNSPGVTLTIPDGVNKKQFAVQINGKRFEFIEYDKEKIIFCKGAGWKITDIEPAVDYRKGTGLLDVYLNSMRIIIPGGASENITRTSNNFSKPFSNGFDPVVCAKYPIYQDNELPDHILSNNLILIDINGNNEFLKRFKGKLPVNADVTGFVYKNNRFEVDYIIMQVIANPYNPILSILVIQTNDDSLLSKHILLRKVIIPTYCNGIHAYWNNEILIFHDGKYFAAYESGDDLKQI